MGAAGDIAGRAAFAAAMMAKALASPVAFGVAALVERDGKILLVRHGYMSGWHLPGGGVHRGEPPAEAILRELREEAGMTDAVPPEFFGLYTRKVGLATNVVALYRVAHIILDFKPNLEVREIVFADPGVPPHGTTAGTRRRLAEYGGAVAHSPFW